MGKLASAIKKFQFPSQIEHQPNRRRSASGKVESTRFVVELPDCSDDQLARQLNFQGYLESPTHSETIEETNDELAAPAAQEIDGLNKFLHSVRNSRDFVSAFEYVCQNMMILHNTWIWISEAGRIVKENGRDDLNIDQSNLKKSLPKDATRDLLSGGSANRIKVYTHRVENKMRTFLYFDLNADEFKCYNEPTYDVLKEAVHMKFSMQEILHPVLFARRSSWNHGRARRLFPPIIRPVLMKTVESLMRSKKSSLLLMRLDNVVISSRKHRWIATR